MSHGEQRRTPTALEARQRDRWPDGTELSPPGQRARPEPVAQMVADLLAAAAERLSRRPGVLPGHAPESLQRFLHILCTAAREVSAGRQPSLHGLPPSAPLRRSVEALRQELLAGRDAADISPECLLAAMHAIEGVVVALDSDEAVRFTEQLAGREGLELLIEVAHDLRSPLGSILFLAEALRRGHSGPINPVQERQLGLVYSAAFGLSSLASDLMELARGGDRLVEAQPVSFSVASIFRAVRDIVQPMAEEKGLGIRLSPPEADFRVGHPAALNRVLLNLTTNSLKFTSDGYVEVSGQQLSRTEVEFSVRDTGRGIPSEVMSSLFEAFRLRESTGDYLFSSAGLGLAICRKLVHAMGSQLAVETAPDFGTRFHFTLNLPIAARM